MNEKPWWVYACQITIFGCGLALLWLLLDYSNGGDSPNMPMSSSTAGLIAVAIGLCLLGWLVVSLVTGKRGGLVDWVAVLFFWWW